MQRRVDAATAHRMIRLTFMVPYFLIIISY